MFLSLFFFLLKSCVGAIFLQYQPNDLCVKRSVPLCGRLACCAGLMECVSSAASRAAFGSSDRIHWRCYVVGVVFGRQNFLTVVIVNFSGIPTVVRESAYYLVVANNSAGYVQSPLSIQVIDGKYSSPWRNVDCVLLLQWFTLCLISVPPTNLYYSHTFFTLSDREAFSLSGILSCLFVDKVTD